MTVKNAYLSEDQYLNKEIMELMSFALPAGERLAVGSELTINDMNVLVLSEYEYYADPTRLFYDCQIIKML